MGTAYSPAAASLAMFVQLRNARRAAGLTQQQVAARLRVVLRTLQRWENAETEPTMSDLFRWAAAVGLVIGARPIGEHDNPVASRPGPGAAAERGAPAGPRVS